MFNKFFKFIKGYVIIDIYGKNCTRFLNICLRRGMRVYGTRPIENGIEISLDTHDFMTVRPIALKCRVKVKIKEKHSFIRRTKIYRTRYILLIFILVLIAMYTVSTRFIWLVEINGTDESNIESIEKTLNEIGVRRGALKSKLPDGMEMKRRILNGTDTIAWAWVYIEGAKARVEIYEKTMPPVMIDKSVPCDIVAACDGVIQKMNVKAGEKRVNIGDAVRTGDLLIAGTVSAYREGDAENYITVHSLAEIRAFTTHSRTGSYKLYHELRKPTGKHKRRCVLDLFGKAISFPFGKISYVDYDRTEKRIELNIPFFGYSGISLDFVEYSEVIVEKELIPLETALDFAKNDLEKKIAGELTTGAVLSDEAISYKQIDKETIEVTLNMNFTENIAVTSPLYQ